MTTLYLLQSQAHGCYCGNSFFSICSRCICLNIGNDANFHHVAIDLKIFQRSEHKNGVKVHKNGKNKR